MLQFSLNVGNDVILDHLHKLEKDGKVNKDKIYSFFYESEKGLVNTTAQTQQALWDSSEIKKLRIKFYIYAK